MNTTLWPHAIPTPESIRKSARAVPASLAQDDYIAFPAGVSPAKIVRVQSNHPAGENNGVVECITVWSDNAQLVGRSRGYQWRSLETSSARLYMPNSPVSSGVRPSESISTVPPPGMLAALSCVDRTIQDGFRQSFANQSEMMDKIDETNRLLSEILAAFNFAWNRAESEAE